MPRHQLHRRRPDRLTLAMAALTTLVLGLGLWAVTHPNLTGDPRAGVPATPRDDTAGLRRMTAHGLAVGVSGASPVVPGW